MYQFIWQKKTPRLRKDLLFLPLHVGGLKVLDPEIQHKMLQKRWLNYVLAPEFYPSFVSKLMITHLSLFDKSSSFPLMPLYDQDYRQCPVLHNDLSIWYTIFDTFDYFVSGTSTVKIIDVPLDAILSMPLHTLLIGIDDSHWTKRHRRFEAHLFMVFDNQQQRLHLRCLGEYTRYPRLCQQLFNDILTNRSIKLMDIVWAHILQPPPSDPNIDWYCHPIVSQMATNSHWLPFQRNHFRQHYQSSIETFSNYPVKNITKFWECHMYPQARTVWYRVISRCIPTKQVLLKYGTVSSSTCSLCHHSDDTLRHFLVECIVKREIWHRVLSQYYPYLFFSPELIYTSLRSLEVPPSMKYELKYFPIISTILWQLWSLYWLHGNSSDIPIAMSSINTTVPRIVSNIERLLNLSHADE